jgi:hypothetical protein
MSMPSTIEGTIPLGRRRRAARREENGAGSAATDSVPSSHIVSNDMIRGGGFGGSNPQLLLDPIWPGNGRSYF